MYKQSRPCKHISEFKPRIIYLFTLKCKVLVILFEEQKIQTIQDMSGYKLFVTDKWKSFQISGWGGYVLKEKFKLLKTALKEWHVTHTQNLPAKIVALKDKQVVYDEKGEEEALTKDEVMELHDISVNIHSLS